MREWREKKDSLQTLPDKKKRLLGGGCKVNNPDMEEELVVWISNLRASNFRVTRTQIQNKALELSQGNSVFTVTDSLVYYLFVSV